MCREARARIGEMSRRTTPGTRLPGNPARVCVPKRGLMPDLINHLWCAVPYVEFKR